MTGDDNYADALRDARLAYLAREADRLAALEIELIDGMASAEAERQRRQIRVALEYAGGGRVTDISARRGVSPSHVSWCARKWGVRMRNAGSAWARSAA